LFGRHRNDLKDFSTTLRFGRNDKVGATTHSVRKTQKNVPFSNNQERTLMKIPVVKAHTLLICVMVIAALLGAYKLDEIPPGLHSDEVINGYEAHCLAETGKDCHGRSYPAFIQAAEDFREGFFVYYLSLVDRYWPCNEIVLRLATLLLFLFAGFTLNVLGREIFDEWVGLAAAATFYITPWVFVLSRQVIRPLSSLPFLILGLAMSWAYLKRGGWKHAIAAGIFLGISLHTYLIARLFAPLILGGFLGALVLKRDRTWRRYALAALPIFALFTLPIAANLATDGKAVLTRMKQVSIFTPKIAQEYAKETKSEVGALTYPKMFISRYASNLSPDFLFKEGDPNERHSLKGLGQMYWAQIPLILAAFAFLIRSRKKGLWLLFGVWLLTYPLPAAGSVGSSGGGLFSGGHAYRSLAGAPLFALLSGLGMVEILRLVFHRNEKTHRALREIAGTAMILLVGWYIFNAYGWFKHYYVNYKTYAAPIFGGTTHKALPAANIFADSRKYILVKDFPMGFPDYYAAFYSKFDPEKFQARLEKRHAHNLADPIGPWAEYSRFYQTKESFIILSKTKLPGKPIITFKDDSGGSRLMLYDNSTSSVKAIRRWQVCGPFDLPPGGTEEEIRNRAYPREQADQCDEDKSWKWVSSREDHIDLWGNVSGKPNVYALARSRLKRRRPGDRITLFVGSDDGAQMWINEKYVYSSPEPNRSFTLDKDPVHARLDETDNEIMMKLLNGESAWIFSVRIEE